mmetsp:Transcript_1291/g.4305  ORF Transcript_1291/g.4305 Transcript_1291/m.4305 type:complete len:252 (-) Transcript_1291:615-1370(-)
MSDASPTKETFFFRNVWSSWPVCESSSKVCVSTGADASGSVETPFMFASPAARFRLKSTTTSAILRISLSPAVKLPPRCMPTKTPQSPYPNNGDANGRTLAANRVSAAMLFRVPAARAVSSVMQASTAPPAEADAGGSPLNCVMKPMPHLCPLIPPLLSRTCFSCSCSFSSRKPDSGTSRSLRNTRPFLQCTPTAFPPTARALGSSHSFGACPKMFSASGAGWYPKSAADSRHRIHSVGISVGRSLTAINT